MNIEIQLFKVNERVTKNESMMPKFKKLYNNLQGLDRSLRQHDVDLIPNLASRLQIGRWFKSSGKRLPELTMEEYDFVLPKVC